jgi:hypothetical protein
MTGTLSMGGQVISSCANIKDNQSSPHVRIAVGGSAGTGVTGINDSSGVQRITVSTGTVALSGSLVVSGAMSQSGGTVSLATDSSDIELGGAVTFDSGLVHATWTATKLIFVDATNGDDGGDGTPQNPFQTLTGALNGNGGSQGAAAAGCAIFLGPGTYSGNFVIPSGVSLIGSGRGATTVYKNTGTVLTLSNNAYLANLTVQGATATDSTMATPVRVASGLSGSLNWVFDNVDLYCPSDGVLLNPGGGTLSSNSIIFHNCDFYTGCWSIYDTIGCSIDCYDCNWSYFAYSARTTPQIAAIAQGASGSAFRAFGGNITVNYAGSATNFTANAAVTGNGVSTQFYGTNIYFNCPSVPSTALVIPFVQSGGGSATVVVGRGTAFSGTYQSSSTNGLLGATQPTIQVPGITATLSVSSSAVTPTFTMDGVQNEVAVDAGTLTSGALTINAPSPGSAADGCVLKFRIKNTNSGSTAMTLSMNSVYNAGSASVGTIPAGKRAYLSFVYDTDNSKWDLTGYSNGL